MKNKKTTILVSVHQNCQCRLRLRKLVVLNIIMITAALFSRCDKDELSELEKLPPETQSGKRTFGCLVDGKAWVIERVGNVNSFYQTGTLSIAAGLDNDGFSSVLSIVISDSDLKETTYTLGERLNNTPSDFGRYYDNLTSCEYFTTVDKKGFLTIAHFDKVNNILSGRFEFDAYSSDCSTVIRITSGRFDILFAP